MSCKQDWMQMSLGLLSFVFEDILSKFCFINLRSCCEIYMIYSYFGRSCEVTSYWSEDISLWTGLFSLIRSLVLGCVYLFLCVCLSVAFIKDGLNRFMRMR